MINQPPGPNFNQNNIGNGNSSVTNDNNKSSSSSPSPKETQTTFSTYHGQTTPPQNGIRFDIDYLKTRAGIVKVLVLICNFAGFLVSLLDTALSGLTRTWTVQNVLFWLGILVTTILLAVYLFHIVEMVVFPWALLEFGCCIGLIVALILGQIITSKQYIVVYTFSVTFFYTGLYVTILVQCAITLYIFDAYVMYRLWRKKDSAYTRCLF